MLSNWPLQNAHPTGAKLPPNSRISPMNGSTVALAGSVSGRENAGQADAEVHHLVRLKVRVRLAVRPRGPDGFRRQGGRRLPGDVLVLRGRPEEVAVRPQGVGRGGRGRTQPVGVGSRLRPGQGVVLLAPGLA